jgi:hypothetical protein
MRSYSGHDMREVSGPAMPRPLVASNLDVLGAFLLRPHPMSESCPFSAPSVPVISVTLIGGSVISPALLAALRASEYVKAY